MEHSRGTKSPGMFLAIYLKRNGANVVGKAVRRASTITIIMTGERITGWCWAEWVFVTFRGTDCQGCVFRAEEGACERRSNCLLVPELKSKRSCYGTAAGSYRRVSLASGRARSVATFQPLGMIGIVDVCRICPFRERRSCLICVWDVGDASTNGVAARLSWNACLRSLVPWPAALSGSQRSFGYSDTLRRRFAERKIAGAARHADQRQRYPASAETPFS